MDTWAWIVIVVGVVVLLGLIALAMSAKAKGQQRRSNELRQRFGTEYDRRVVDAGDRRQAERGLVSAAERHDALDLRPLNPAAQARYQERWRQVETRFVEAPDSSVAEADRVITEMLREVGYPVEDPDHLAMLAMDHPRVLEPYRRAHAIAEQKGRANTDEQRQAVLDFRALAEDLLSNSSNRSV